MKECSSKGKFIIFLDNCTDNSEEVLTELKSTGIDIDFFLTKNFLYILKEKTIFFLTPDLSIRPCRPRKPPVPER